MQFRRTSLLLFSAIIGATVGLLVLSFTIDLGLDGRDLSTAAAHLRQHGLKNVLGPLPEVLAAMLGLMLTVVAIVVQLAAQRYSTKVIDLFLRDKTNLLFFLFMVISCSYVTVVPIVVPESGPTPVVTISVGLLLCIINFTLLLPYVAYVFTFLQPGNIIRRIQGDASRNLRTLASSKDVSRTKISAAQSQIAVSIERISDSCLSAIQQADRFLAVYTIEVLEQMLCDYLEREQELPEAWADIEQSHFFMLSTRHYREIVQSQVWVEAKILYEFEHAFRCALRVDNHDILARIASATTVVGLKTIDVGDLKATRMVIRFFNTFARHALNAGHVRTCYSVFYQYRSFALGLLSKHPQLFARVCDHFVYYGRLATEMGYPFVTVTATHDLSEMCMRAHDADRDLAAAILRQILSIVDAEDEAVPSIDVLQTLTILGTRLLECGDQELASLVQVVLQRSPSGILERAQERILAVKDWKFWEITERGEDFNYLQPSSRGYFQQFISAVIHSEAAG